MGSQGSQGNQQSRKPVCWDMRDRGTCSRGDSCPFSHDPTAVAEARQARQRGRQPNAAAAAVPPAPEVAPPDAAATKGKGGGKG
eukprot:5567313-Alexandrium_andersonii.AAC.1